MLAATGVSIGKRQLEQITIAAAADAERFYQDRPDQAAVPAAGGRGAGAGPAAAGDLGGRQGRGDAPRGAPPPHQGPGAAGADLREAGRDRGEERLQADGRDRGRLRRRRPGRPGPHPGAGHAPGSRPRPRSAPRAENRWYACDITAGRDVTIGKIFDEADRRDPDHLRTWIALVDGDIYQLGLIQAAAAARGITLAIVIDFIHVLEYLWKAAWCFHPPRDPAMEDWVIAQALDILHGRAGDVIARIGPLAADHPPRPGGEHAKIIRKTLSYLQAKQPFMDYPRALANGWPIATGVIEGACRHLVQDRMGITGARWGLEGAQAMLWLRAINASGDTSAYWDLAHHPRTPAQPPQPLPGQPRTRRLTLTPEEPHPCRMSCSSGTTRPWASPAPQRRGRKVDKLDRVGPHERIWYRLGLGARRCIRETVGPRDLEIGDIAAVGIDVDAAGQKLPDRSPPAFRVALAGSIRVREFILRTASSGTLDRAPLLHTPSSAKPGRPGT